MKDDSSETDPRGQRWFYSTDAIERNFAAYLILIGGSIALALWVSPWFWILAALAVLLTVLLIVARSRRSP